MSKKASFSFDGMVDLDAEPEKIPGVTQRGAEPASASEPERKRGRPPIGRAKDAPRPSFALDPETHALFKIWLLRKGVSMQDYLEDHIKGLVKDER